MDSLKSERFQSLKTIHKRFFEEKIPNILCIDAFAPTSNEIYPFSNRPATTSNKMGKQARIIKNKKRKKKKAK